MYRIERARVNNTAMGGMSRFYLRIGRVKFYTLKTLAYTVLICNTVDVGRDMEAEFIVRAWNIGYYTTTVYCKSFATLELAIHDASMCNRNKMQVINNAKIVWESISNQSVRNTVSTK